MDLVRGVWSLVTGRRRPAAVLVTATALVMIAGTLPASAAVFPINEPFTTSITNNPAWEFGGDPNSAVLTNQETGWLRLTSADGFQTGYAVLNDAFSSALGIVIDFQYAMFGGMYDGDGFSFYLIDGTAAPSTGAFGGGLGYACANGLSRPGPCADWAGVTDGYVGVGFDAYGNFSTNGTGNGGIQDDPVPNQIVVRGSGTGMSGYPYLAGVTAPGGTVETGDDQAGVRSVRITILHDPLTGDELMSVYSNRGYDADGAPTPLEPVISDLNLSTTLGQKRLPSTLKLGFAASTGGATNIHEIRNLTVAAPTDLSLTKTATPSVSPGGTVQYTLDATNNFANPVTDASVQDIVPAGVTGVSWTCTPTTGTASCGSASGTGNNVNVPVSFPAQGDAARIVITGTASQAAANSTISNTATITPPDELTELTPDNNTATASTTVGPLLNSDLATAVSVNDRTPPSGGNVVYTVTVRNNGPDPAYNTLVTYRLPAGMTYVSDDSGSTGTSYDPVTGVWTVGTLAPGASQRIRITARTDTTATTVGRVTEATSSSIDPTPCDPSHPFNCGPVARVTPRVPHLRATKTASTARPAVGSNVTFTVRLANLGNGDAHDVRLTDRLPAGLTFVAGHATAGSYDAVTGVWRAGTLRARMTATLTIVARVTSAMPRIVNRIEGITSANPARHPCTAAGCGPGSYAVLHPVLYPSPSVPVTG